MINTGLYLEDQLDDSFDQVGWHELELWGEGDDAATEYFLALQKLPTEQELLEMEDNHDDNLFDDRLLQRERRTALRL